MPPFVIDAKQRPGIIHAKGLEPKAPPLNDASSTDPSLTTGVETTGNARSMSTSVREGLAALLPDLRGFGRFLTRDVTAADDLVQDTVVRALAAQAQFVPGTSLKAWLFTIQRNAFLEQRRRWNRERDIVSDMETEASSLPPTSPRAEQDRLLDLNELIWKLPEVQREALILIGAQELSYDEAAVICGVPAGTVKARVSRARAALSVFMTAARDEEKKAETERE